MASVHELVSERTGNVGWRVRFRVDGRQKQETFLDPTSAYDFKDLVEKVGGADALKVLAARAGSDAATPTLREFTMLYLDKASGLLTGIEDGTRAEYLAVAERSFLQILGHYPIDAVGKTDVGKWLAWQEKQPSKRSASGYIAPKTIRNYHGLLSQVLAAAVVEKHRADNPAFRMRLPKGLRREPMFLSPDEFSTLLYFIPAYYEPLVLFMAHTGTRWGEATAVTWSDLNFHGRPPTVRIEKAWKKAKGGPVLKHPKSERSKRSVSLTPDAIEALGKPGPSTELVFKGRQSHTRLWYARFRTTVWNKAVAKAMDAELCEQEGLTPLSRHPRIHDLRHSHASWLIARGAPLPYIQARLGHESIQTTSNIYGHLVPDAHEQLAGIVADALAGTRHLKPLELTT